MGIKFHKILFVLPLFGLLAVAVWFNWHYLRKVSEAPTEYKTPQEADNAYVRFEMEAYDTILTNFWKQATDTDMATVYQLSLKQSVGTSSMVFFPTSSRAGTASMLEYAFARVSGPDAKKALATQVLQTVLYNLPPKGRSKLLTNGEQLQLKNTVENVNPNNNLYKNIGAAPNASPAQVQVAFSEKQKTLQGTTSIEGKAELKKIAYAREVLTNQNKKAQYDQTKVEPTVFSHAIGPHTLYVYVSKIAPTAITEFIQAIQDASSSPQLHSLILDFRGNIGGDITFTQNIMSLFLGPNEYAFDLYHQGAYVAQRTPNFGPLPALLKYKEIAVLTDGMTQSTAELTASALRRFHIATNIGTKTRGWGSVEHEFVLKNSIDSKEKYALLLVVDLTLGNNQQPIEQNGVVPDIDTSVAGWQNKLINYFTSSSLMSAIIQSATAPPVQ